MAEEDRVFKLVDFPAHTQAITCLALGHKSSVLVTGGEDRKVNLWTLNASMDGCQSIMNLTSHVSPISAVQFDHSEEKVASGTRSGTFKLWDLETAKVQKTLTGHREGITSLAFLPAGDFIASASKDSNIKLWDIRRKGCIYTYKGHKAAVNHLQSSPDGGWIASAGEDGTVKLWDLKAGKLLRDLNGHKYGVKMIDFHPGELLLASGSSDRTVKFWDLETFQLVSSTPEISHEIDNILFHPSGSCLFAASANMLRVYGWEPTHCFDEIRTNWGNIASMCFTNTQLLAASHMETFVFPYLVVLQKVKPIKAGSHREQTKNNSRVTDHFIARPPTKSTRQISSPYREHKRPGASPPSIVPSSPPLPSNMNPPPIESLSNDPDPAPHHVMSKPVEHNRRTENHQMLDAQNDHSDLSKHNNISPNNREPLRPPGSPSCHPKLVPGVKTQKLLTDELEHEIFNQIEKGHRAILDELLQRNENLLKIEDKWKYDNVRSAIKCCMDLGDLSLVVDMLSVLNVKKDLWNLDLCLLICPKLLDLITSLHKRYLETGCCTLKLILKTFGHLLKSSISPLREIGVDISAEERMSKCKAINEHFGQIKSTIENLQKESGKIDDGLKEVYILMETL